MASHATRTAVNENLKNVRVEDLVGAAEIADYFGCKPNQVVYMNNWERYGFPLPIAHLAMGRIWRMSEIEKWNETRDVRLSWERAADDEAEAEVEVVAPKAKASPKAKVAAPAKA